MSITQQTRKILWARSGNRCSICRTELVLQKDQFNEHLNLGEECHIISRQANGPRHRLIQNFDYDQSDNILLLCCNHHKMVDERTKEYTETVLAKIKTEHESWVKINLEGVAAIAVETNEKDALLTNLITFVSGKHDIEMNLRTGKQIMESEEGLQVALAEAEKVKRRIYETVESLKKRAPDYKIILKDNKTQICDLRFKGHTFLAQFNQAYFNSANGSYLLFAVVHGHFDDNGYADPFYPCTILEIIRIDFSIDDKGQFSWRDQENDKKFYQTQEITDNWLSKFFKQALK